jgi:hypothetical protein
LSAGTILKAAFYCVADERYFLGAAGLVNSLRLHGHREPIFLLDVGLTTEQRQLLEGEVELIDGSGVDAPWLAKTIVPLRHPAEVTILIDVDMVATRSLAELVRSAAGDRAVVFENDTHRFVPEWGELLDLGEPRRQPYVNSGLVALGGSTREEVLRLLDDRQRRVDVERTIAARGDPTYAFLYPEQDVLNAILATRIAPDRVLSMPNRLAPNPPYRGLRITDLAAMRCAHRDGTEPYVLHQFGRKPWFEPAYHGVYPRLLARALLGPDVAIKVPERLVPVRMRTGARALAERAAANVYDIGRWYLGERLPAWVARRRAARREGGGA